MTEEFYKKRIDILNGIIREFSLFSEGICDSIRERGRDCVSCPFFQVLWDGSHRGKDKEYRCRAKDMKTYVENRYNAKK